MKPGFVKSDGFIRIAPTGLLTYPLGTKNSRVQQLIQPTRSKPTKNVYKELTYSGFSLTKRVFGSCQSSVMEIFLLK